MAQIKRILYYLLNLLRERNNIAVPDADKSNHLRLQKIWDFKK